MRKYITFVMIGITLLTGVYVSYAAKPLSAPYGLTLTAQTPTEITISWSDSNTYPPDSVSVIDGSDSTFYAYFGPATAAQETTFILSPNTVYDLMVRQERGDTTVVSNVDTLATTRVQIENRRGINRVTEMWGARSDRNTSETDYGTVYDTLVVRTATGLDSTTVYHAAPFMNIMAWVNGHADSSKVKLNIYPGEASETNTSIETTSYTGYATSTRTGAWDFPYAAPDSVQLYTPGWNPVWRPRIPASEHFYIRADGQTDNGQNTQIILKLQRRWSGETP